MSHFKKVIFANLCTNFDGVIDFRKNLGIIFEFLGKLGKTSANSKNSRFMIWAS